MRNILSVGIDRLVEEPYASIICYPRASKAEIMKRLKELKKLRVKAIEFRGEKEAFNIPVLGKGCVGIVVIAHVNSEKAALKIRRVDADRDGMLNEARMLDMANAVMVGPRLLNVSENFLLMQFIDGKLLPAWLDERKERPIKSVLHEILEQCWRLDCAGLDHGELSNAPKHIIVDEKESPFIVDFETSSLNRKPSNVTSICHFLFLGGVVAEKVAEKLGERNKEVIIEALRVYKGFRSRENFESVLEACGLK